MQDIVEQLVKMAEEWSPSTREHFTMMLAASEIDRLRKVATASLEASPPTTIVLPVDRFDDIDRRIAELESRVRLTQHRLAAAAQMCADIDRDPRVHTTVQACFSHVGKALESEPQEDDSHV